MNLEKITFVPDALQFLKLFFYDENNCKQVAKQVLS